ncbi:MAG TPA: redoxin domain-containing protein [Isosphaeraceae bacterium]|jgi:peroxiredoxin/mono/diheme cytochrome c family protein
MTTQIMRRIVLSLGLTAMAGADAPPVDRNVGQRMPNFTLKSLSGETIRLYGYAAQRKKAVVLVFTGNTCPLSDVYAPRLVDMARKYEPQGVVFLAINANAHESAEDVAKHAKELGIAFPVLKDPNGLVADLALAMKTPEVVVLDGRATIRYRGAIDDQYVVGKRKPNPEKNYLADALDAVIAGKPVAVAATEVSGCPIERGEVQVAAPNVARVRAPKGEVASARAEMEKKDGPVEVGKVTYAEDVATILQAKCQNCHRPGQSGPFSLLTYDDARAKAAAIALVVDERRMPPWHADPRHGQFANDRSLSPKQRATLLAWVEQGTPLGDAGKVPPPARFVDGWSMGTPDLVIEMPRPYTVPAQGVIDYVFVRVPTNFKEDRWIQAAEAVPGDRSVVHHIVAYVLTKDSRRPDENHLCGYAPGDMPSIYPPGIAKKIPAGAEILLQLHYTPNGKVRTDRSKIGLVFAKAPVEHEAHTLGITNREFAPRRGQDLPNRIMIPAGDPNFEIDASQTFPKDVYLLSFMPHMHLRGKDFKYTIVPKDGTAEVALAVPAYDFGWQSYYHLTKPSLLPAGTRIDCVAHFDNSKDNPANPDPTKAVGWGDQTFEEMMIGYIDYYDAAPIRPSPSASRESKPGVGEGGR